MNVNDDENLEIIKGAFALGSMEHGLEALERLVARVKMLEDTLSFYAEPENHHWRSMTDAEGGHYTKASSVIDDDGGARARAALAPPMIVGPCATGKHDECEDVLCPCPCHKPGGVREPRVPTGPQPRLSEKASLPDLDTGASDVIEVPNQTGRMSWSSSATSAVRNATRPRISVQRWSGAMRITSTHLHRAHPSTSST